MILVWHCCENLLLEPLCFKSVVNETHCSFVIAFLKPLSSNPSPLERSRKVYGCCVCSSPPNAPEQTLPLAVLTELPR